MESEDFSVWELERHQTTDIHDSRVNGDLTVIWRDWDKIIKNHPKMVYVNSINPGEVKGPHLHKNRTSYFYCIHGNVVFVIQDKDGNIHEIETDPEKPVLVSVPNGIASAFVNPTNNIVQHHQNFPLGIDMVFVCGQQVISIARTTNVEFKKCM